MSHDWTLKKTEVAHPGDGVLETGVDAVGWAWATEHGAPERASTEQLVSWLARGELPPHTLVWKPGWAEWLPAMQVAELAQAFPSVTPGSRRVAQAASDCSSAPPPVPVAHYPRLRLLAKDVVGEPAVAPLTGVSQGLAPARAERRALRDLDYAQKDLVTSQVPAAAMLEAARAMKRLGAPVTPRRTDRWGQMDLGTFGEAPPPNGLSENLAAFPPVSSGESGAAPPLRTLSPHALELVFPESLDPESSESPWRQPRRYGRWLSLGALVGGALGLLAVRAPSPEEAAPTVTGAETAAEETTRVAPSSAKKTVGVVELKREGEPAFLRALRAAQNDGFDRVVFEFEESVPGYRLEYIDGPARDCGTGDAKLIDGDGRLEVRFSPASAHTERGVPSLAQRELEPALSSVREIERTCDLEGVVSWVIGTASPRRYRAFELAAPPRLVVDIDH